MTVIALDRRTSAIHEAGHAVVARMLDLPCWGLLLDHRALEERNLGGVALVPLGDVVDPRKRMMVAVAGMCAHLHAEPDDYDRALAGAGHFLADDGVWRYAPGSDWATIEAIGGTGDLFGECMRDVRSAFESSRVWGRVEAVADVLYERGHVGQRELEALVP